MIEVKVDSVRVSLMNQQRLVVLKDLNQERYLPIWIGQFEADAITIELQETEQKRPLTHDLLKSTIVAMGGRVTYIHISDLRSDIFYARVVIEINGKTVDVDARPSDAIALAVRTKSPIFVSEAVMSKSSVEPEQDIALEDSPKPSSFSLTKRSPEPEEADDKAPNENVPSAFASFLSELDFNLDDDEDR